MAADVSTTGERVVRLLDHVGFAVTDIYRAHNFYGKLFGSRPLAIVNLKTRTYSGWPIMSFIELGQHRFELALAQHPLPDDDSHQTPRLGFVVANGSISRAKELLDEAEIAYQEITDLPAEWGVGECLRISDRDGNVLDLASRVGDDQTDAGDGSIIKLSDIYYQVMEVTDLDAAEQFYISVLDMKVVHRDDGERGKGRVALRNDAGQLVILELVEELSARSRFCGPNPKTSPHGGNHQPYAGPHLAIAVDSAAAYDTVRDRLIAQNAPSDGDVIPGERPGGERSEYFYDPAGNRLQLLVLTERSTNLDKWAASRTSTKW